MFVTILTRHFLPSDMSCPDTRYVPFCPMKDILSKCRGFTTRPAQAV